MWVWLIQVVVSIFTIFENLQEFFNANPVTSVERTVKQSCENIRLNTQWLGRDREAIEAWLNSQL